MLMSVAVRKLLVITFSLFVLVVVGCHMWSRYVFELDRPIERAVANLRTSSAIARWWRCKDTGRPLLTASRSEWLFQYSWEGGMGPGDVTLVLSSKGNATVRSMRHGQDASKEMPLELSKAEIAELGSVIDDSGLLCQSTRPRDGYTVMDLGRYAFQVKVDGSTHELVVDSCRTIPDTRALSEVFAVLKKHKGLPEEIDWGPYATVSVPGSCAR